LICKLRYGKLKRCFIFEGGLTIGGAIGTGAHGSTLKHPSSLSDQVLSLLIVDGSGEIRNISDPIELQAFRLHLGLCGIVISITFKTVPLYKLYGVSSLEPESILTDGTALNLANSHDFVELLWFPNQKKVVVVRGTYTYDLSVKGNAYTTLLPDTSPVVTSVFHNGLENVQNLRGTQGMHAIEKYMMHSLYQQVVGRPPAYWTENGMTIVNPAIGFGWKMMCQKCTPGKCLWENGNQSVFVDDTSIGVDVKDLPEIVQMIKNVILEIPAGFPVSLAIRFYRASDAWMSPASGRNSAMIEIITPLRTDPFNTAKFGLGAYQAILQSLVIGIIKLIRTPYTLHNAFTSWF
jgi:L-gulonolactone oxidase